MAKVRMTPGPWKKTRWPDKRLADGFKTVITDSRGHGILAFMQYGKNAKVEANAELVRRLPEILEALDNVTAALEATLAFYQVKMPEADKITRRRLVCEARKITNIWRQGVKPDEN